MLGGNSDPKWKKNEVHSRPGQSSGITVIYKWVTDFIETESTVV